MRRVRLIGIYRQNECRLQNLTASEPNGTADGMGKHIANLQGDPYGLAAETW